MPGRAGGGSRRGGGGADVTDGAGGAPTTDGAAVAATGADAGFGIGANGDNGRSGAGAGADMGLDAPGWLNGFAASGRAKLAPAVPWAVVAAVRSVARAANSSRTDEEGVIVISPPQTAQRARTIDAGNLLGSTRKTDRHSGQGTFTCPPGRQTSTVASRPRVNLAARRRPPDSGADRPSTRSR